MLTIRFAALNVSEGKRPEGLWALGRWYVLDDSTDQIVSQGLSFQDARDLVCAVKLMSADVVAPYKSR